jgi:hypothetical protein
MKREVAAVSAGFSVEYVRFQTGRKIFGTQACSVHNRGMFCAPDVMNATRILLFLKSESGF